ncbi:MAG: glycosyltransferase [Phycisphaerae bacterium]|nr:glycosyltransferase [Phycisphaerae bacterium]
MKWLFVTSRFPWPLVHGRSVTLYHTIRTLARAGDRTALLCYQGEPEAVEAYRRCGVEVLEGPIGVPPTKGPSHPRLAPFVHDAELAVRVAARAGGFDTLVLMGAEGLQYAPQARPAACVVAFLVDDPMLEVGRRLTRQGHPLAWLRDAKFLVGQRIYENAFVRQIDLAAFVSRQDVQSFARRHPQTAVAFVPNGVDLDHFAPPVSRPAAGGPTVVFMGNLEHPPNDDAARFLIRRIAPRIWARRPQTLVAIVGCAPSPKLRRLAGPRIDITGFLDDPRPRLWDAAVAMAPMRIGTGIKNKLLEAWAARTAVVATPLACQGIPARPEANLLVGCTADQLAGQALRLLDDAALQGRIAEAGRRTVEQEMAWPQTVALLRRAVLDVRSAPSMGPDVQWLCPEGPR